MTFFRAPRVFAVEVDGRQIGETFRSSSWARDYADELRQISPWSHIEVVPTIHTIPNLNA